jgi:hypothetical protein
MAIIPVEVGDLLLTPFFKSSSQGDEAMSEEIANNVVDAGVRTSLSQAVKHTVNATTGIPGLGDVAGQVTNAAYPVIPNEVKVGAGAGGLLCVHMGTHIIAAGTAGSIAYGGAVLAAFLPFVAVGAAIGGGIWAARKIAKHL